MNKKLYILLSILLWATHSLTQNLSCYNVVWDKQSINSSESMPCGGGDIGMNVWVENDDILFYFSRSGTFDENNTLLKLGRIRIRLIPNPFNGRYFHQELKLENGHIIIKGENGEITSDIRIWADVFNPVINININNNRKLQTEVFYENWRYKDRLLRENESNQNSYKWAAPKDLVTKKDLINFNGNKILFYHRNTGETIFDVTVKQQGLDSLKTQMFDPIKNLIFGGTVEAKGFVPTSISTGTYAGTDYMAWKLTGTNIKNATVRIRLHTAQTTNIENWKKELDKTVKPDIQKNIDWWHGFWNRSFIKIQIGEKGSKEFEIGRNYQLFRYMLGCNAFGEYPTKFNGGLFTYDPVFVDTTLNFTPDFRKWGGGTHTAQNQRLVYFPMLRSGDAAEMMKPQFDFYKRTLPTAKLRSKIYWGHGGACFTEQIENFGLPNPSEYGWKRPAEYDKGMEYNAWLEYQWDTVLEFCFMILEYERYTNKNISGYIPLIENVLQFFDEHYQYLAKQRGQKAFDEQGKLVLYPGSACETYKMAYNSTSTIAALQIVSSRLLELDEKYIDSTQRAYFIGFKNRIPEIKTQLINEHETIAPAWLWERVNNVESPQLYPVFPWGIYGLTKSNQDIALNTWKFDKDVIRFRSHIGWKQDVIWATRLGLKEEAKELITKKQESAKTRFPVFWGPGYDWTPDHNWGGSGMIALQEMLLQVDGSKILLFPCWDKSWDVHFKLHAPYNTTVECKLEKGIIKSLIVTPKNRETDIIWF
ncbi:hypothetical protein EZS27_012008 [termite gut metagenome]|uniref:DUF5703 domain-containing protein n=1 Tax=termite gut metagenome TaxID=433724 RepID=A0A5J4S3S4_9ZZZZ